MSFEHIESKQTRGGKMLEGLLTNNPHLQARFHQYHTHEEYSQYLSWAYNTLVEAANAQRF